MRSSAPKVAGHATERSIDAPSTDGAGRARRASRRWRGQRPRRSNSTGASSGGRPGSRHWSAGQVAAGRRRRSRRRRWPRRAAAPAAAGVANVVAAAGQGRTASRRRGRPGGRCGAGRAAAGGSTRGRSAEPGQRLERGVQRRRRTGRPPPRPGARRAPPPPVRPAPRRRGRRDRPCRGTVRPSTNVEVMREHELTIGDVVERTGVSHSAVRFYEARALIHSTPDGRRPAPVPPGRAARASPVLRVAQRIGMSLQEISDALALPLGARTLHLADWERLARTWRRSSTSASACWPSCGRFDQLHRLRLPSLRACRLYNPADGAAGLGQGPATSWATPPPTSSADRVRHPHRCRDRRA